MAAAGALFPIAAMVAAVAQAAAGHAPDGEHGQGQPCADPGGQPGPGGVDDDQWLGTLGC